MLKTRTSRKQFDLLSHGAGETGLEGRFLESLAETLDIAKTIEKLNITAEDARMILKGLIPERGEAGCTPVRSPRGAAEGIHLIYVDGASRGNPGRAGAGAVIKGPDGSVLKRLKKYLDITTNNMAEYRALIIAFEAARSLGIRRIRVFADSELMVKQINGQYRVKSADLRPLYEKAVRLLKGFEEAEIEHVYREENSDADALANEAIDGRAGQGQGA